MKKHKGLVHCFYDTPPSTVAENIALDNALIKAVGKGEIPPHLRLYKCTDTAVVIGRAQKKEETVYEDVCKKDGIPVLQRFSGGGTVLITPGCLVFSVVFIPNDDVKLYDVKGAYHYVLIPAVQALRESGIPAEFHLPCDIAIHGKKCAGNAQAQKKNAILVHGSFLIDTDIDAIARYLKHPPDAPDYRQGRSHTDFLCQLSEYKRHCDDVRVLLHEAWAPETDARLLPKIDACHLPVASSKNLPEMHRHFRKRLHFIV